MNPTFLATITCGITFGLALYFLLSNRVPANRRRMIIVVILLFGAAEIFLITNFVKSPQSPKVAAEDSMKTALSKYPPEAQSLALTRSCMEMQREVLSQSGVKSAAAESAVMPICVCMAAALMKGPEFAALEEKAATGAKFADLMGQYAETFTPAMGTCMSP